MNGKEFSSYLLFLTATVLLWCLPAPIGASGAAVRDPVWAGKFYPANREDLDRLIRRLIEAAEKDPDAGHRPHTRLRALMMPHAGFAYSGATAAHAALAIPRDQFGRVVLLGHRSPGGISQRLGYRGLLLANSFGRGSCR